MLERRDGKLEIVLAGEFVLMHRDYSREATCLAKKNVSLTHDRITILFCDRPWIGYQDNTCKACKRGLMNMCENQQVNGVSKDGGCKWRKAETMSAWHSEGSRMQRMQRMQR